MLHLPHKGSDYVVSRVREEWVELVNTHSGQLERVRRSDVDVTKAIRREKPILPNLVAFLSRPKEFLAEVRRRRIVLLEEARRKRKTLRGPSKAPGETTRRTSKPRAASRKQLDKALVESKLSALPPEMADRLRQMLKGDAR